MTGPDASAGTRDRHGSQGGGVVPAQGWPRAEAIRTPRLRLEPLRVEDADEMVGVLADPDLYVFIGGAPPDLDDLRGRYAAQAVGHSPDGSAGWLNWTVRLAVDGRAIGFVQATVTDRGRTADLAWLIGVPWQGRGFATEAANAAFHALSATSVEIVTAHVRDDHVASAGVARRIGLHRTDTVEDGERVWLIDIGARAAAARRRSIRIHVGVGLAVLGFGLFEVVMVREGQLPGSADQVVRDVLLAGAGIALAGSGVFRWLRHRHV